MNKIVNITPPYETLEMYADLIDEFAYKSDACYAMGDVSQAKKWSILASTAKKDLIEYITSLEAPKKQRALTRDKQGEKNGINRKNKPE